MKKIFEIKDKSIIYEILDQAEYGTLALSFADVPYAVPLNFVRVDESIYFHGALMNKKMKILAQNLKVSFSVVENHSLIDSDFSSTEGLACPATQFFKSVSMDGIIELVESREEKVLMFESLMKKLQPKGGYRSFDDEAYEKVLKATAVYKLVPSMVSCKFKFGQNLSEERFQMIVESLEKRGSEIDRETIKIMKAERGVNDGI